MKKIIIILFISCLFSQVHFNLNIDETGESTLIILQSSISGLQEGDEIGIFDNNGIINNEGDVGQILVGSGVWDDTQLEIVAIHSLDFSQFGGPILPGAVEGNEMSLKVWDASDEIVFDVSYLTSQGSGNFDGLFSVLSYVA